MSGINTYCRYELFISVRLGLVNVVVRIFGYQVYLVCHPPVKTMENKIWWKLTLT